jgi:ATP-dependent exoDNAse (exonuclease V) alpha subunit
LRKNRNAVTIPHFRGDFVGAGKSPLSSAAYNHRTPMTDLSIKTRFYSKSDHDLVHAEIAFPLNSPAWIVRLAETGSVPEQSAALWNTVITNERNELAQTARKFIAALLRKLIIGTLIDIRTAWAATVTRHLQAAGHDFVLDLRSYAEQRVKLTPTTHIGPNGTERRAKNIDSTAVDAHVAARELSAEDIERDPGCIIRLVARQQSVFDRRNIARALHTFIDLPVLCARALDRALAHPELHRLAEPETDANGKDINPAKFTTTTMFALESRMFARALELTEQQRRAVSHAAVTAALKRCPLELSEGQTAAIVHITRGADLASIVGYAGTGKSTLLQVAASAWTNAGHEVVGGALASKAAGGLQASSDIPSKTVAKWIWNWNQGDMRLSANSVFVLDEAGMVGSVDMAAIVAEVTRAGAKLVLVGDPKWCVPGAGEAVRRVRT